MHKPDGNERGLTKHVLMQHLQLKGLVCAASLEQAANIPKLQLVCTVPCIVDLLGSI